MILIILIATTAASAADWEDLSKDGWAVAQETQVDGEFEGCDFGKQIPLTNGMVFVCQTYNYSYSYMPQVYILMNVRGASGYKVMIEGVEYDGTLYRR